MKDTYSTEGPKCPYCEHQHVPDDPFYYDEYLTEMECGKCERTFCVQVEHSTSWTANEKPQPSPKEESNVSE